MQPSQGAEESQRVRSVCRFRNLIEEEETHFLFSVRVFELIGKRAGALKCVRMRNATEIGQRMIGGL